MLKIFKNSQLCNLQGRVKFQNCLMRLRRINWNWRTVTRWCVLPILFMMVGCGQFSKPASNPPLTDDLKTFEPFPQPTGDKGRDALQYAAVAVAERSMRRDVVELYCMNARPC